jgi:hypothetical protein
VHPALLAKAIPSLYPQEITLEESIGWLSKKDSQSVYNY